VPGVRARCRGGDVRLRQGEFENRKDDGGSDKRRRRDEISGDDRLLAKQAVIGIDRRFAAALDLTGDRRRGQAVNMSLNQKTLESEGAERDQHQREAQTRKRLPEEPARAETVSAVCHAGHLQISIIWRRSRGNRAVARAP
jgi:hypothetical protein